MQLVLFSDEPARGPEQARGEPADKPTSRTEQERINRSRAQTSRAGQQPQSQRLEGLSRRFSWVGDEPSHGSSHSVVAPADGVQHMSSESLRAISEGCHGSAAQPQHPEPNHHRGPGRQGQSQPHQGSDAQCQLADQERTTGHQARLRSGVRQHPTSPLSQARVAVAEQNRAAFQTLVEQWDFCAHGTPDPEPRAQSPAQRLSRRQELLTGAEVLDHLPKTALGAANQVLLALESSFGLILQPLHRGLCGTVAGLLEGESCLCLELSSVDGPVAWHIDGLLQALVAGPGFQLREHQLLQYLFRLTAILADHILDDGGVVPEDIVEDAFLAIGSHYEVQPIVETGHARFAPDVHQFKKIGVQVLDKITELAF